MSPEGDFFSAGVAQRLFRHFGKAQLVHGSFHLRDKDRAEAVVDDTECKQDNQAVYLC